MEYIDKIKKMLCKELDEYAMKTSFSMADVDAIHKLTDTVKNLDKIAMLEEDYDGYSSARMGRGRGSNAKRDNMGRYSSDGGYSSNHYYDDNALRDRSYRRDSGQYGASYDGAKEHMMNKLGEMMDDADPKEREALKECMRAIERA